jgi:hypothetical protein
MSQLPAHEILGAFFGVIIRAAKKDPAFAQQLMQALSSGIAENSSKEEQKSGLRRLFDPSGFHAINILRTHGEDALRGKLEQVRAAPDLRLVATFSGLVLSGRASKSRATREDLVEGIVAAARHYVAQRDVAAS